MEILLHPKDRVYSVGFLKQLPFYIVEINQNDRYFKGRLTKYIRGVRDPPDGYVQYGKMNEIHCCSTS